MVIRSNLFKSVPTDSSRQHSASIFVICCRREPPWRPGCLSLSGHPGAEPFSLDHIGHPCLAVKHARVRHMPIRIFQYALAFLLLLFAAGGVAVEPAAADEEAEFQFRLVVDAPSELRDTLQRGLDIARWQT